MVRINLINPKYLTDQHLIAEYSEMLILMNYVKRYPEPKNMPKQFTLGTGHMIFFKNKLKYIKNRHDTLRKEMIKRGFHPHVKINLSKYRKDLLNNWKPDSKNKKIIKRRIIERIKQKPEWYRYYGEHKSKKFYLDMTKKG